MKRVGDLVAKDQKVEITRGGIGGNARGAPAPSDPERGAATIAESRIATRPRASLPSHPGNPHQPSV